MIHNKRIPEIDGLRVDEAHKGGKGAPKPTAAQLEAEAAQAKELADLEAKEQARIEAMGRRRRGRASLLGGSELGQATEDLKQTLGA